MCAVLFAVLTWQVAVRGPLLLPDERVELRLAGRGPQPLAQFCADLGGPLVALPVLVLAVAYALWRGRRGPALTVALAAVAVPLVVVPLKVWTDRPGPLTDATGYYPSGHTATAMIAYGGAALLLAPYAGWRRTVPVAVLLTLATGTGLLLRGYHWPVDVLASVALCGMLLVLAAVAGSYVRPGRPRASLSRRTPRRSPGPEQGRDPSPAAGPASEPDPAPGPDLGPGPEPPDRPPPHASPAPGPADR